MRIGMLLMGGSYPPDIRVEKEAKVLAEAGHEVFLLTTDRDGRPNAEQVGPISVTRYPARAGFLVSKANAIVTLASWRSPLWERAIRTYVDAHGIEALHVHDLPAVASAAAVARSRGIPVVFDMHENYPAAVSFWKRSRVATMLQTPARYRVYERSAVLAADRIVAVVEESRRRLIDQLGADQNKVIVFGNVDDTDEVVEWAAREDAPFTVAYAGGFGPHRGIDTLVRALAVLRESVRDARLVLMGSGEGEAALKVLAEAHGVSSAIDWTGWVDTATMRSRLAEASVGVVPHARNEHTDSTVPHKLFQYMAMGLPVTVTDCAPLARIVTETGAGTVARAGDPRDLAAALAALAEPGTALAASAAGRRAVASRYNLRAEGRALITAYEELSAASPSAASRNR